MQPNAEFANLTCGDVISKSYYLNSFFQIYQTSPVKMSTESSKPHILEHPVSSYVQKVKIALREKSVDFTTATPPDISSTDPGPLHTTNPRVEVPVLLHDGNTIFDSTIILEYIEDVWPSPPLLPSLPAARAKARTIEDVCDTQYEAINWVRFAPHYHINPTSLPHSQGMGEIGAFGRAEGALKAKLEAAARRQTEALHVWLEERLEGPWFDGERFGWADLSAAPMINRSVMYGCGPAEGSRLWEWHRRLGERESVRATFAEYERGLEALRNPAIKEAYLSGARKREYRDHRLEWMLKSGGLEIVTKGLEKDNIRFSWP